MVKPSRHARVLGEAGRASLVPVLIAYAGHPSTGCERDLRRAEREAAVASPREQAGPALGPVEER